jgi:hypothetical protein
MLPQCHLTYGLLTVESSKDFTCRLFAFACVEEYLAAVTPVSYILVALSLAYNFYGILDCLLEKMSTDKLHQDSNHQTTAVVTVHALSCGHFSLPEYQFVHPVSRDARRTVPSLGFLIQHYDRSTKKRTRIVFDLGLRRDVKRYAPPIQKHIETRQPMSTDPDVTKSLARGGLAPEDIDYVIYSHVSHSTSRCGR